MRTDHRTPQCECLTREGTRCAMPGTSSREIADGRRVQICDLHVWRSWRGFDLRFIPAPAPADVIHNAQIPGRT